MKRHPILRGYLIVFELTFKLGVGAEVGVAGQVAQEGGGIEVFEGGEDDAGYLRSGDGGGFEVE